MIVGKTLHRVLWQLQRTPAAPLFKEVARIANRKGCHRRRQLAGRVPRTPAVVRLAGALERDGYAVIDEVIDPIRLAELGRHAEQSSARAAEAAKSQVLTHKTFWVRLSDLDQVDGVFSSEHPLVRFATQPGVVGVLTERLAELPQLSEVLLSLSRESSEESSYSQLWHRDYDDVNTIKVFVYLTDVTSPADGPFTFIPGPASDRYRYPIRSHLPDEDLLARVGREHVKEMIAPRLTTFVVETSRCWHMGSRMQPGHVRLLYTANFFRYPRIYGEPPPRFRQDRPGDEVTHGVLFRE